MRIPASAGLVTLGVSVLLLVTVVANGQAAGASSPTEGSPGQGSVMATPPTEGLPRPGPVLKFIAPRPIDILKGVQTIELAVPPEAGAGAAVEIQVDGAAVAKLDGPPYKTSFDFGGGLRPRKLGARILTGPAAGLTAEITTRGLDLHKVDAVARVNLVTLFATVRNASGKYLMDLSRDQFRVFDSGRPQTLTHFAIERRPLALAVLLDVSFSMRDEPIVAAREAAIRFVKTLSPDDRVMVMTFSDRPQVLSDLTTDREAVVAALSTVEAKGGTALYDAIYSAADRLSREEGRKAIVLLSDGHDEAQNGVEPGSLHTFEEALEKSLRSEVILFTIGFGKKLATEMDFYGRNSLKQILDRLAEDSGGSSHYPTRTSQLKGAYDLIGEELRNQYSLAFAPSEVKADGSWHPMRVEVADPTLKVFTRRGYYAPKG